MALTEKDTLWYKNRKKRRGGKKSTVLLSQILVLILSSSDVSVHPQFVALSQSITGMSAAPFLARDIVFPFFSLYFYE